MTTSWRKNNPERAKEHDRKYRESHPDQNKSWKANNREKLRGYERTKYLRHKDTIRARIYKWQKDNPDKVREYARKANKRYRLTHREINKQIERIRSSVRRARKRRVTVGDLTDIAWVYKAAQWWKQWFDVQVDHIIPLSRNGTHEARNLQIIYRSENRDKWDKLDYKPRVIFCVPKRDAA